MDRTVYNHMAIVLISFLQCTYSLFTQAEIHVCVSHYY